MKYVLFLFYFSFLLLLATCSYAQSVGVGTASPSPSAKLDISSTSQGLLPPRMTTTQRNAINSPAAGLIIFNVTSTSLEIFNGLYWTPLLNGTTGANNVAVRKLYGGSLQDNIYAMQPANDGGFFMAGSSSSTNSGTLTGINNNGGSNTDMWVMKTDAAGNLEWQKLLGGIYQDAAYSVNATSDGGCIVAGHSISPVGGIFTTPGYGANDGVIIKLNAAGSVQWYKLLGGSGLDGLASVQQTADGGYIACGNSLSSNTGGLTGITGNGGSDAWIVKMDNAGNIQWQKLLGGNVFDALTSIIQTSDGGYIGVGSSSSSNIGTLLGVSNNGGSDVWVIKMDNAGNLEWQKLFGGTLGDYADGFSGAAIKKTGDGGYIVGAYSISSNTGSLTGITNNGAVNGTADCWIIKLNGFGSLQWQKLLGGSADEKCYGIIQTTDAGFVAVGYSESSNTGNLTGYTSSGYIDAWIIKLDNSGNLLWQKLLGGSGIDITCMVTQVSGGFAVAGYSNSAGTGYLTGLSGNGGNDGWFFKLDMFGNTY